MVIFLLKNIVLLYAALFHLKFCWIILLDLISSLRNQRIQILALLHYCSSESSYGVFQFIWMHLMHVSEWRHKAIFTLILKRLTFAAKDKMAECVFFLQEASLIVPSH